MKKAKLTKAQAKVIQRNLGRVEEEQPQEREYMIRRHIEMGKSQSSWAGENEALNVLSIDTLCRALYVGYEIIEEDQVIAIDLKLRAELKTHKKLLMLDERARGFNEGFDKALSILGIKL